MRLVPAITAGWREKTLWAGAIASCAGVITAIADRATTREFTIACLAAFCLTSTALQVSWVSKRIDRMYQAEQAASRAEIRAMKLQLARVTGPQLSVVPPQDRTLPSRGGSSRSLAACRLG